jgi:transposase-like protein
MTHRRFDPTQFFDDFHRFVETDELGSGVDRLNARYLALIHSNRELLEGASVLDLASHDGRFSFAALQNGAARVVGIDYSAELVQKSIANMEYYDVPVDRYEFLAGDIFELIDRIEYCDVVFCFGILYHINHHMLLLMKIAELDPRALIVDTAISQLEVPAIELHGPADGRPLLGQPFEGWPSRAALDAMFSSFGWTYRYFEWEQSGLTDPSQMLDYRKGKRVSVVVDCNRQMFSTKERKRAVQLVLDNQRGRRSQTIQTALVASRLGMTRERLHAWVRKAEREAAHQAELQQSEPPKHRPN